MPIAADKQGFPRPTATQSAAEAAYATRPLNPHRAAAVLEHARDSYLDVGCGNGGYVRAVPAGVRAFGVDWRAFSDWPALPGHFAVADAGSLPFADRAFHTVSCFETLEHLPDPERALNEIRRVAGNTVLLTVPNCEVSAGQRASNLIYHHWVDPTHKNFWSFDDFVAFVESDGWSIKAQRINEIDLVPLALEAFAPSGMRAAVAKRLLRRLPQRKYPMTTLVVARRADC